MYPGLNMELKYGNKKFDVDIKKDGDQYVSAINGTDLNLQAFSIAKNISTVRINGKTFKAYSAADDNKSYVTINGNCFVFDKVKDEEKSYGDTGGSSANIDVVKPPMPGSIVKIIVEKGQTVKEGDGLIIVEAMKMETTLYSSIDGIVTEINVKPGEQVDSDKALLIIEKIID
jgi:biotin carboxyl carrier protein